MCRRWMFTVPLLAAAFAGCGGDDEPASTERPAAQSADLAAVKTFLLDHTAAAAAAGRGHPRGRRGATTRWPRAPTSTTSSCCARSAPRSRASSSAARSAFGRANPAYEEMEGVVAGVPSLADYDVIIDAGGDASDPENAVPFSIQTPDGRDLQAARQPQLPDRDVAVRHRAEVRGARASSPTSTATAASSSARRCPTPASTSPPRASSTRRPASSTRPRAGLAADAAGRADRARGHDADDVRVLRGVEELALRGRRAGDREGVRGRLAPAGHHRHPQRAWCSSTTTSSRSVAKADAQQARQTANDLAGAARLRGPPARRGARRQALRRRRTPTRSAARRRSRPRRSPARSPQAAGRLNIELET